MFPLYIKFKIYFYNILKIILNIVIVIHKKFLLVIIYPFLYKILHLLSTLSFAFLLHVF
jgi:hypothetical protein